MVNVITPDAIEGLRQQLSSEAFLSFAASECGLLPERIAQIVADYTAEVAMGARVLDGIPLAGRRILEVGAGLGLLSILLKRSGCAITALEPGANGFDANAKLGAAVLKWLHAEDLPVLGVEADQIDPALNGSFDVIFSINVLEHIPDLSGAIAAMTKALAPGGVMVHLCPNYAIPYEPHFGLLLVPGAPRATARLLPHLVGNAVWASLNFVTASQVRGFGRRSGLTTTFRKGMTYEAFMRLDQDDAFGARHPGLVSRLHRAMKAMGVLRLLRHIPATWATPMVFEYRRQDA